MNFASNLWHWINCIWIFGFVCIEIQFEKRFCKLSVAYSLYDMFPSLSTCYPNLSAFKFCNETFKLPLVIHWVWHVFHLTFAPMYLCECLVVWNRIVATQNQSIWYFPLWYARHLNMLYINKKPSIRIISYEHEIQFRIQCVRSKCAYHLFLSCYLRSSFRCNGFQRGRQEVNSFLSTQRRNRNQFFLK